MGAGGWKAEAGSHGAATSPFSPLWGCRRSLWSPLGGIGSTKPSHSLLLPSLQVPGEQTSDLEARKEDSAAPGRCSPPSSPLPGVAARPRGAPASVGPCSRMMAAAARLENPGAEAPPARLLPSTDTAQRELEATSWKKAPLKAAESRLQALAGTDVPFVAMRLINFITLAFILCPCELISVKHFIEALLCISWSLSKQLKSLLLPPVLESAGLQSTRERHRVAALLRLLDGGFWYRLLCGDAGCKMLSIEWIRGRHKRQEKYIEK